MRRSRLLFLALVAGCSKGPEADLQYIAAARSLAAEWAMVNEQASEGKLTAPYISSMHKSLRQQLESARSSMAEPTSPQAVAVGLILDQPDDARPTLLRAYSDTLKAIEDSLESA